LERRANGTALTGTLDDKQTIVDGACGDLLGFGETTYSELRQPSL